MTYTVHTENLGGFTINIFQETDIIPPNEFCDDNAATIYTKHNRYFAIGQDLSDIDGEYIAKEAREAGGVVMPLYAYVHSGVAFSVSPFSCRWDSGQAGFVIMTAKSIIDEYGALNDETKQKAVEYITSVVNMWNDYYSGNVYGYDILDSKGDILDACGMFYGDYDAPGGCLQAAREAAEYHTKQALPLFACAGLI